jgi:hypothetical protein
VTAKDQYAKGDPVEIFIGDLEADGVQPRWLRGFYLRVSGGLHHIQVGRAEYAGPDRHVRRAGAGLRVIDGGA